MSAFSAAMSVAFVVNMFRRVYWELVNWNSVDLLLDDDWVWDLDGDLDWIWDLNFLDDRHFHDLDLWHFLVVVLVDGVDWNFDASNMMFTD